MDDRRAPLSEQPRSKEQIRIESLFNAANAVLTAIDDPYMGGEELVHAIKKLRSAVEWERAIRVREHPTDDPIEAAEEQFR